MRKLSLLIIGLVAAFASISCGGDGEAKAFSKSDMLVQNVERLASLAAATSGAGPVVSHQAGSLPAIGAFVRHFGGPMGTASKMQSHALKPGQAPETAGGQSFYFDVNLQLWVDAQWSGKTFNNRLYLDQTKSKPVGAITISMTTPATVFPQSYTAELKISS